MADSVRQQKNERIKIWLDQLYLQYHRREWIGTDPIKFVHQYSDPLDQELIGLIAASLAYGNVTSINVSIQRVLDRMELHPRAFLESASPGDIRKAFKGFRHRWTDDVAMADLLTDMQGMVKEHGSLGALFAALDKPGNDLMDTLGRWVARLQAGRKTRSKELLSDPKRNSACKRLHLYLRWMVRKDEIDLGCWKGISPARLMIPLDTHVFGIATACGFTRRKVANGETVREITDSLRAICPEDPIRYDFALTRPGIIDGWKPGRTAPWVKNS